MRYPYFSSRKLNGERDHVTSLQRKFQVTLRCRIKYELDINFLNFENWLFSFVIFQQTWLVLAHFYCRKTCRSCQNYSLLNQGTQKYVPHFWSNEGFWGTVFIFGKNKKLGYPNKYLKNVSVSTNFHLVLTKLFFFINLTFSMWFFL